MTSRFDKLDRYVYNYNKNTFFELLESEKFESTREEFLAGKLFSIFSDVFDEKNSIISYEQQILDYIRSNYMKEIKIENITKMVGLDRRYMTRIFRKGTGMTVQEFLIKTRLENAEKQLKQGKNVMDAALLSGYVDVFHFSKSFKKLYGVSSKNYMK